MVEGKNDTSFTERVLGKTLAEEEIKHLIKRIELAMTYWKIGTFVVLLVFILALFLIPMTKWEYILLIFGFLSFISIRRGSTTYEMFLTELSLLLSDAHITAMSELKKRTDVCEARLNELETKDTYKGSYDS